MICTSGGGQLPPPASLPRGQLATGYAYLRRVATILQNNVSYISPFVVANRPPQTELSAKHKFWLHLVFFCRYEMPDLPQGGGIGRVWAIAHTLKRISTANQSFL